MSKEYYFAFPNRILTPAKIISDNATVSGNDLKERISAEANIVRNQYGFYLISGMSFEHAHRAGHFRRAAQRR